MSNISRGCSCTAGTFRQWRANICYTTVITWRI